MFYQNLTQKYMRTARRKFDCYCIFKIWTNKHIYPVLINVNVRLHNSVRLFRSETLVITAITNILKGWSILFTKKCIANWKNPSQYPLKWSISNEYLKVFNSWYTTLYNANLRNIYPHFHKIIALVHLCSQCISQSLL